jgi:hypothetical protein
LTSKECAQRLEISLSTIVRAVRESNASWACCAPL